LERLDALNGTSPLFLKIFHTALLMHDQDLWRVMRQDDNGNEFLVGAHASREDAEAEAARLEARGHKQTYWVDPPSLPAPPPRVISIQSFVNHGRVGNSVATFALQRMGIEVCPIHTVTYSSHLGYKGWRGQATPVSLLEELLDGLSNLSLWEKTDALLTGFLKDTERAEIALDAARRVRGARPETTWICDPVLGDQGRLYVDASMIDFYKGALSQVDILTPNASELGWLSGKNLEAPTREAVLDAARQIAGELRPGGWVIAKGWQLPESDDKQLELFVVSDTQHYRITAPRWPRGFAGAGDLFAACLTAALLDTSKDAPEAAMEATCKVASILEMTWRAGADELELIRAQGLLEQTSRADVSLEAL
jgi:pyridoxine kinase